MDIVAYYQENPLFYSEHKEPITLGSPFIKRWFFIREFGSILYVFI